MGTQVNAIMAFNRGIISRLGLARVDVKRLALAAETMVNWIPRVLGSMSIRPGLGWIGASKSNLATRMIPFQFAVADTAILEFTNGVMRVWSSDSLVTRSAVTAVVSNGNPFVAGLTSWTDNDEAGATSQYSAGLMELTGNGTSAAIRDQTVTVNEANIDHSLSIHIARGPVTIRVGTSTSDDSYVSETSLATGYHNLAFTPTGNFNIRFMSRLERSVYVTSCAITAGGTMEVTTPYLTANLDDMRFDQSGDIVFIACKNLQQMQVERRDNNSWSVAYYYSNDGPFGVTNTGPITITPSALVGNITLTASKTLFRSTHVGALFKLVSTGQAVTKNIAAAVTTYSDPIRITGVDSSRIFTINISGSTASTVTLQRSLESDTGPWENAKTWASIDTTETYDDGLDNQIAWYQIGVEAADYGGADNITVSMDYALGSISGIVRITAYSSGTSVSAEVLRDVGNITATSDWYEGAWSDRKGWPTAVALHENRLWWAGKGEIWGSISDAFTSYDDSIEGATGMIDRLLATGGTDTINWICSGQRLLVGAQSREFAARSSSLDEPLTPTAFTLKAVSTQGSGAQGAVKVDSRALFVGRTGTKIYEMAFNGQTFDYASDDLTKLVPELGKPSIARMAVQRQPDTRVHAVRSDGVVMVGVFDKNEDVLAWCELDTSGASGIVEDVVIFPADVGSADDKVYYVVNRTINGSTVRYIEKMAQQEDCLGATQAQLADSFVHYSGMAANVITGLSSLEGENVVVWADGVDVGTDSSGDQIYTVSGGQITLAAPASDVIVGLPYTAQWKSAKLGNQLADGTTTLNRQKLVDHLGLIMADVHPKGLQYGLDFDTLRDLPEWERGQIIDPDLIRTEYDHEDMEFTGEWDSNARICLQAAAPRPCTMLGISFTWIMNK